MYPIKIKSSKRPNTWQINSRQVITIHAKAACKGHYCSMHNPSNHHMRDWPMLWRSDTGVMERLCPCGVGHPDPDDAAYNIRIGQAHKSIHGCCGCCNPETAKISPKARLVDVEADKVFTPLSLNPPEV
jgi:hypothetical protein